MPHVEIGDVFELSSSEGLLYGQCIHRHGMYGHLVRMLPGLFAERPATFSRLADQREKFIIFFPLQAAVSKRVAIVVGAEPVPERLQNFPVFRTGYLSPHPHLSAESDA